MFQTFNELVTKSSSLRVAVVALMQIPNISHAQLASEIRFFLCCY